MKPTKILLVLLTLSIIHSQFSIATAQPGNSKRAWHWYFGDGAGLDFSSGQAVADTLGQIHTDEGCAAISDTVGNLLFYTDGSTVWNAQHQIMQNGTGLLGDWSGMQNSIIVPKPKSNNIFYIFTNDSQNNGFVNGVRYSTVDMSLDGGFGAIIEKNILLMVPAHEQLAAVHHANCEDIWVVCHKLDEDKFYSYLVTKNGVDTVPVITEIGNAINLPYGAGMLIFSPNGKKVISFNYWDYPTTGIIDTIELYDFDKNTGILFNRITLTADTMNYGFIFSPDNSKLYVNGSGEYPPIKTYQFNLNSSDINNSKQIIHEFNQLVFLYGAQYSPIDNSIYQIRAYTDTVSIILNPNALGTACNYEEDGLVLMGRNSQTSFPEFITSYFNKDTIEYNCNNVQVELIEQNDCKIYPNPFSSYTSIKLKNKIKDYKLYNLTGKQIDNNNFKIKLTNNNSYLFTNKKLKGGIYILSGMFANDEKFNIKLIIY